jgi:alcohol dehydrogenase (NADP+)
MAKQLAQVLRSGKKIPAIGLGTWRLGVGNVKEIVEKAVEVGYRHIDCAAVYENETMVGKAFSNILENPAQFKVQRSEVLAT